MKATVTDLQRRSATLLQQVDAGETVQLTRHGTVCAEIVPAVKVISAAMFAQILREGERLGPETAEEVAATLKELDAAD
jgi:antitoxin (DNA-binding transcriptional repressor) of toxin-antitoxin stability system